MSGGTVSDWIIAAEGTNANLGDFHTAKLENQARLNASGLPVFKDLRIPLTEFNRENKELTDFLEQYNPVVIRALPKIKALPRRFRLDVNDYEGCLNFLEEDEGIDHSQPEIYDVLISEYEPDEIAGVIISRGDNLIIEVAMGHVPDITCGRVVPHNGIFDFHGQQHYRSMRYSTDNVEMREFMWRALQYIREDKPSDSEIFPNVHFKKGYFEFAKSIKGRIVFRDYIVNEAYLS